MTRGSRRAPAALPTPLTHFLCISLVTETTRPQLEASLAVFRNDVAAELSVKAIRPVGTLHLTLGVMSLNATKLAEAVTLLQSLDLSACLVALDGTEGASTPLKMLLRGLESMHEPDNTSILYIEPRDQSDRLLNLCLTLRTAFEEKALMVKEDRALKLHATVVNTIYAKGFMATRPAPTSNVFDGSTGHGVKARGSLKFDARNILDKYKDYVWAEDVLIDRIAICEMGAKKIYDDDGRLVDEHYKEVAQILLSG